MAKDLKTAELLDIYGGLLNKKQRAALEQYYFDDLSLSEISENVGISRQGVNDLIKRAEAVLHSAEDSMGLYKAKADCAKLIEEIRQILDKRQDVEMKDAVFDRIDELERIIKGW